jgi:DNA (cytosine-5)-methyltransferase 1
VNAEVVLARYKAVATSPKKKSVGHARAIQTTPFIDVFAGCGGFSEGFSSYSSQKQARRQFDLKLAVDNNGAAHQTHLLRQFFHEFETVPQEYFSLLRQQLTLEELYSYYPREAAAVRDRVILCELGAGPAADAKFHQLINERIAVRRDWVLIGGPPCQAFSIAGRSRNKGNENYIPEADSRHFLYKEYLKVLALHWPAVFVMENVTGMLNSRIGGQKIWHRILEDLADPAGALSQTEFAGEYDGYRLFSLVTPDRGADIFGVPTLQPDEYVVKCENYGIPQTRHRVFILGVRSDLDVRPRQLAAMADRISCGTVLNDLPPLRSGLSRTDNSDNNWLKVMRELLNAPWWKTDEEHSSIFAEAKSALHHLALPEGGVGGQFVPGKRAAPAGMPPHLRSWLCDSRIKGVCNHESRAHMESDVHRYVFAACYTKAREEVLRLGHFPAELLPAHENVKAEKRANLPHASFTDRFAVQAAGEPARTIVSHIAKDGHYYIHPDARQGRSLTVREAARIQTFPDNFYFPGSKTDQYRQVGNAVPPYLAFQIAEVVDDVLIQAGM